MPASNYHFYLSKSLFPENFSPVCGSFTDDGQEEFLCWIAPDDPVTYYPDFFRTELLRPQEGIRHFATNERKPACSNT